MDICFQESYYQNSGQACLADLLPPTFAGIASLMALDNGALRAAWPQASDVSLPIRYRVFIQEATQINLFAPQNRLSEAELGLETDIFQLPSGEPLESGKTYYVGIRAVDAVGNESSNLESLSMISKGVTDANCAALVSRIDGLMTSLTLGMEAEAVTSVEPEAEIETLELDATVEVIENVGC